MNAASIAFGTGVFGKLPARGDFICQRLPTAFVEPWDAWLRAGLIASHAALGERWLPYYLMSPVWRFALSAGTCGGPAVAGVMVPSVDAANRHYPLTIASLLPDGVTPFGVLQGAGAWLQRCEDLALRCLEPDLDVASLPEAIEQLGGIDDDAALASQAFCTSDRARPDVLALATDVTPADVAGTPLWIGIANALAASAFQTYSVWWTAGSDELAASLRIGRGLPAPDQFALMLADDARRSPVPGACSGAVPPNQAAAGDPR